MSRTPPIWGSLRHNPDEATARAHKLRAWRTRGFEDGKFGRPKRTEEVLLKHGDEETAKLYAEGYRAGSKPHPED